MLIDNIRLGQQSRDQLIRLKRITGIENWNVLCRWAFCLSIADKNSPPRLKVSGEAAVEMSWKTFAGEYAEIYSALLIQRAHIERTPATREVISELLRNHIIRGIGFLTARRNLNGIGDLLKIAN
ncbi:MAG: DNA sulfur modification protein DndE [Nibricoccus sp.]